MIVIAGYDPENAPRPTPENAARGKAQIHPYRERALLMDAPVKERRTAPKRDKIRTSDLILPLKSEVVMQDFTPPARQNWQRWDKDTSTSKRVRQAG